MGRPRASLSVWPFSREVALEQFVFLIGEFVAGHGSSSAGELPAVGIGLMNNVQFNLSDTA
jgi:hypothetical protein